MEEFCRIAAELDKSLAFAGPPAHHGAASVQPDGAASAPDYDGAADYDVSTGAHKPEAQDDDWSRWDPWTGYSVNWTGPPEQHAPGQQSGRASSSSSARPVSPARRSEPYQPPHCKQPAYPWRVEQTGSQQREQDIEKAAPVTQRRTPPPPAPPLRQSTSSTASDLPAPPPPERPQAKESSRAARWRPRGGKDREWHNVFHEVKKTGASDEVARAAANASHKVLRPVPKA